MISLIKIWNLYDFINKEIQSYAIKYMTQHYDSNPIKNNQISITYSQDVPMDIRRDIELIFDRARRQGYRCVENVMQHDKTIYTYCLENSDSD